MKGDIMDHLTIKEAIKLILKEHGIKDQAELAYDLNVSQATISNYMNKEMYPALRVAATIYLKYGIPVEPYTLSALEKEANIIERLNQIGASK